MSRAASPRRGLRRLISVLSAPVGTLTHAAVEEPLLALTFDDGPDPEWTPRFLDALAEGGGRATFFMVGQAAARHPELVERVAREGHAVGNHGWDHLSLPLARRFWRRTQIRWCQEALGEHGSGLFRPPYGHQSCGSFLDARLCGMKVVGWNVIAEDWNGEPAEDLLRRVRRRLEPGSIVLFHDTLFDTRDEELRDRTPTLEAVRALLAEEGRRYRFVTVPELLQAGRARYWPWLWRPNLEWLKQDR